MPKYMGFYKSLNKLQMSLIFICLGILQFPFIREIIYFNKIKICLLILIFLIIVLSFWKLIISRYLIDKSFLILSAVVMLICTFSFFNVYIYKEYSSFGNQIIFMLFPLIIGMIMANDKRKISAINFNGMLVAVVSIQVICAVLFKIMQIDFSQFSMNTLHAYKTLYTAEGNARLAGTLGHPIVLAFVCIPVFFLSYQSFKITKKKLYLVLFLLVSAVIMQTFSRGTWIGILGALFLAFMLSNIRSKFKIISLSTIVLIAALLYNSLIETTPVLDRLGSLFNSGDNVSVSHRTLMFTWGIERYLNHDLSVFFGIGYGLANTLAEKIMPIDGFPVIDNSFISMFIELGVINMVLVMSLIFWSLFNSYKSDKVYLYILVAMLLTIFTFDVSSWHLPSFLFWLIIGYTTIGKNNRNVVTVEKQEEQFRK
ncbi:O-antigen ligase family protein [Bacillus cereus group sp. Bce040]|uniref:O-antigen ligase family protein n=1 Tax=Bacillus cereus group sp. Bce040 TaxID=3445229 RepID=UPI003F1FCC52